ncbi:hypothetical protein B4168_2509 [Anoxybacillus flavithermus]|nr:hypothetical protein B4168_2509 [Anoxybacillus flavithermus]OAO85271.1 hypothetical protein GT23_2962 [Parageobacillus thermoglucosidasius]
MLIECVCGKMKEKEKNSCSKGEEVRLFDNIFGSVVGVMENHCD